MVDMHESSNSNLAELLRENKGEYFSVDLTDILAIDKFYNDLSMKYDKIDLLYNVAGTGIYKKIGDLTIEDWNLSVGLNLTAPFYLTKKLTPLLNKSGNPLVFNI